MACATFGGIPREDKLIERRYLVFGVLSLATLAAALNNTMIVVALNTIRTDLDTTLPRVAWVLTAFMLAQSIGFPLAGTLNDLIGRKRGYLIALGLFTFACAVAGLAPSIYVVILARACQGLASGMIFPLPIGIASDEFPDRRAQAVGLFSTIFPIGGVIGPTLGGLIIQSVGWRLPFLALGWWVRRSSSSPAASSRSIRPSPVAASTGSA
jgi:MFS family permease